MVDRVDKRLLKTVLCVILVSSGCVGCASAVQKKSRNDLDAERIAHAVSVPLFAGKRSTVDGLLQDEMKTDILGVIIIDRLGDVITGYIRDDSGEVVTYDRNFGEYFLTVNDEVSESLIFYKEKLLGLVRVIRRNR
jgi:hypothetical protein